MTRSYFRHLALLLGILLTGCTGNLTQQSVRFPAVWPGTEPLDESAPSVSVSPIGMLLEERVQPADSDSGYPTSAVLSALFVKHLHVNGIHALLETEEEATGEYTLNCRVPELGYDLRQGYPKQRIYQAELTCTLRDQQTQTLVWERSLNKSYEETQIFDMMTKLPDQPHEHERILFRECIVPLWDTMASVVGTVLVARQQIERDYGWPKAATATVQPDPVPVATQPQAMKPYVSRTVTAQPETVFPAQTPMELPKQATAATKPVPDAHVYEVPYVPSNIPSEFPAPSIEEEPRVERAMLETDIKPRRIESTPEKQMTEPVTNTAREFSFENPRRITVESYSTKTDTTTYEPISLDPTVTEVDPDVIGGGAIVTSGSEPFVIE